MGKSILSNSISKLGEPISEGNNARRKMAVQDIAKSLDRCYRDFFKYNDIHDRNKAEIINNIINDLKREINLELMRISAFSGIKQKGGLNDVIDVELEEVINRLSHKNQPGQPIDIANENVINDFEEMRETLFSRNIEHLRTRPIMRWQLEADNGLDDLANNITDLNEYRRQKNGEER